MRAFAACLTVVLGLGAFSVVACSSDATTTTPGGDAGEAGAPSSPAAGGGGATSTAGAPGAAGEAGAPSTCSFDQPACGNCLQTKCTPTLGACIGDNACSGALSNLEGCACDASKTIDECKTTFAKDGGDPAAPLVTCYDANCASSCE